MLKDKPIDSDSIQFILDGNNLVNHLEGTLEKFPSDLVLIDTWGDLVGGNYESK